MNLTALALVGVAVGVGQPPADYYPMKSRSLKLEIDYKKDLRQTIQRVELCVSRDQGQTWGIEAAVTPDRDHFVFTPKEDGLYWVTMMIVFRDGRKDPPDIGQLSADRVQKLMVDATAPVVRLKAQRAGEEVVVEWAVEDKFPNDAATQVSYRPTGPGAVGDWQPVPAGAVAKNSARFKPATTGPIAVQVTAYDLAGNPGSLSQEVSTGVTVGYVAPSSPPRADPPTHTAARPPEGPLPPPSLGDIGTGAIVLPPSLPGTSPINPTPAAPPEPTGTAGQPPWSAPATPAPLPPVASEPAPQPIAVGVGHTQPTAAAPPASTKHINFLRFELQYQLESGPSGVSRIDLYVTRDDGRTWGRWSQHDGRESPLRVQLDTQFNQQQEGDYGFRLVPVSGAGLTDGAPKAGTPPEMRVAVDVTPPMIEVYKPTAHPSQRNTLVLHWKATDRSFGRDPIAIEWSEQPTGPWKPVAGDGAVSAVSQPPANPNRVPNTGSYPWALPANLTTPQVYLKFSAWDVAGNRSEAITQQPVLVDLMKPRVRIQGIESVGGRR
ncbi:MAG TPA: hypothetical protein VFG68_15680 [Fimbriiglobus sp.]|nr:hypothetical protein [Fimbriiglobus sp.]